MVDNVRVPADGAGKRITTNIYNDGVNDFHTQVVTIGDRTDPSYQQSVQPNGAAIVEFSAGAPQFDAFNRMMVATDDLRTAIKFYEGPAAVSTRMEEQITGNASISFDPSIRGYVTRTEPGAGNKSRLMSHRHLPYSPGSSFTTYFVVAGNAPTQTGVARRVGIFNDSDGIYMELRDGEIFCVIRNSLTGIERRTPQSAWNADRLDGTGGDFNRSGAQLNPTSMNIFAINYQYLSAGAVNFYTFVDGRQILIHSYGHYGELDRPYMGTTKLPFTCETENITGGQVGNTDVYIYCAAIVNQGYNDEIKIPIGYEGTKTLTSTDEVPIMAFRPTESYFGEDNRNRYLFATVSGYSSDEPVILSIRAAVGTMPMDPMVNATWSISSLGLEMDTDATGTIAPLPDWGKMVVPGGQTDTLIIPAIGGDASTDGLFRNATISNSEVWVITGRKLTNAGGNTDVTVYGTMWQLEN
jgi:hypothetical protein